MFHDSTAGGPRRKLTDILNGSTDSIQSAWNTAAAAKDFEPLPAGLYTARLISGELSAARSGTPGFKLTFKVIEGEHAGRQFWHDVWLTPAAMPMAKRDLGKLGVTSLEQLERPLPPGIRCAVKLTLRREDDGTAYNRVKSFDVIGIDADPTADPDFAPRSTPPTPAPATAGAEPEERPDVADSEIDPAAKVALWPERPLTPQEAGK